MSAWRRFKTIVLAASAFGFAMFAALLASGFVAGVADSAGIVLSDEIYLAASVAFGALAAMHVAGFE